MMDWFNMALLFGAALLAGAMNAVAGGGSFFSFPALLMVGIAPVTANATNAVALWPASLASVGAYRRELAQQRHQLLATSIINLVGGTVGALLLLQTKDATFAQLIPWLLLFSTVLFASSGLITRALRRRTGDAPAMGGVLVPLLQFVVAVYGGFFGAGLGIMLLAALALLGLENIHEMNAVKVLLSALIAGVAVIIFSVAGAVQWPEAIVMIVGGIVGGYGGAVLARKINPLWVRRFVIGVGVLLTAYYFVK